MSREEPSLHLNNTIEELLSSIEDSLPVARSRLEKFTDAFDKEFPADTHPEDRGRAEAITWALMGGPLVLYALEMNGSAIVELHGIFERFALRETINHLVTPSNRSLASRVFERLTLPDVASTLHDLGILGKEDVKFAKKLNRLRNGLAHKNPRVISNMAHSGKKIHILDIDSVMIKFDCVPLIIGTIQVLIKMSKTE